MIVIVISYSCEQTNEPEEKIKEIQIGGTYDGEITEKGAVDRLFFTPNSNHYVHIICKPLSANPNFHPEIKIFDSQNQLLGEHKDQIQAVIQSVCVKTNFTYEIQIKEWGDNETGKYLLNIEVDPDDDKSFFSDINYSGNIQYIRDVDYFNIQPSIKGDYHISVIKDAANPNLHPEVSLYYLNTLVKTNKTQNETVLSNLSMEPSWKYSLVVKEWGDNEAGKYQLSFIRDTDDSSYFYDASFSYEGLINFYGDQDRIYFYSPYSGNYNISLKPKVVNSGYHPAIEMYKSDNTVVWSAVSQTECKITGLSLQGNVYYRFNVHDWGDNMSGKYILSVEKQ